MTQDLTTGIRRAATPPRAPGHRAPSTAGVNQGAPAISAPVPVGAPSGGRAPAFPAPVARHEDRGWHELHAVEMRGYTETLVAVTLGPDETLTLDPTRAQVWRVAVTGAATIVVPKPEFPEPSVLRQDAPERMRTWSCVLIVSVPSGGIFPTITGAKWSEGGTAPNVLLSDGEEPEDYGGRYIFTFVYDPVDGDVIGIESGVRI